MRCLRGRGHREWGGAGSEAGEGQAQELGQDQAAQVSNKWEGMWVMGSPDALQKLAQELG